MSLRVDELKTAEEGERLPVKADVAHQPASFDIWDKKYRLKSKDGTVLDQTVDHTSVSYTHLTLPTNREV